MNLSTTVIRCGVAAIASACLGACGGGGSDSSTPAPAPAAALQAANLAAVGDAAARLVVDTRVAVGVIADTPGLSAVSTVPQPHPGTLSALLARALSRAERRAMAAPSPQAPPQESAQAVQTVTQPCGSSGTLTVTTDDRGAQGVSTGDVLDVVLNQCVEAGLRMSGGLRMTLDSVSGSRIELSYRYADLTLQIIGQPGEVAMNGTARAVIRSDDMARVHMEVDFEGLQVRTDGTPQTWVHQVQVTDVLGSPGMSLSGELAAAQGRYRLSQSQPFRQAGARLTGGPLKLEDAVGNHALVHADEAQVFTYTLHPAGAAAPSVGPIKGLGYGGR